MHENVLYATGKETLFITDSSEQKTSLYGVGNLRI